MSTDRHRSSLAPLGMVIALTATALAPGGCKQKPTAPPAATPQRIVCLAPSATEILFAVGAGPRVVAVDSFSDYPPEAAKLPKIGDVAVNYEAVVAAKPDLVVGIADLQAASLERCRGLGLNVLALDTTSLPKTVEALRVAGGAVGSPEQGRKAAGALERELSAVSRAVAHMPRVRTLCVAEASPAIIVAGRGTFLDEVIHTAGGENATSARGYASLGREAQRQMAPEVVLAGDLAEAKSLARVWPYPARVVAMPRDVLVRPGPRLGQGARWLAGVLHPEVRKP